MTEVQHPFQVGVEVALISRGGWDNNVSFERAKVAKVYKNGHFVLENGTRFRPNKDHDGWAATATSGRGLVGLITEKLIAEVESSTLRRRFRNTVDLLCQKSRKIDEYATVEQVEMLEKIAHELKASQK